MVLVGINVEGKKVPLYMDGRLYKALTKQVIPSVRKKDFDYVIIVDGEEGSGKSVFAQQLGKILDPELNLSNICFTAEEFINAVTKANKNQCIIFDEAFTGLSSRSSLSEVNNLVVSLMMEMRQKNLFIILVMPTLFMLDKYAVLQRAKGLFHVYMRKGTRGFWRFFGKRGIKFLYLNGKKQYDYSTTPHKTFGRFKDQYTINESKYRVKKGKAFGKKKRKTKSDTYKEQRDILIYAFMKEMNKPAREMSRLLPKYRIKLSHVTLSEVYNRVNDNMLRSED